MRARGRNAEPPQVVQVTIADELGARGEGVAEIDGRRVFVPLTLPGEIVRVGVAGDRGSLDTVLAASPHRVAAFCKHFGSCGGCTLQHLDAQSYAGFKRGLVAAPLQRAGLDVTVGPLLLAHGDGRRRATLHARREGAGFMVARSHQVHDLDRCPILVPALRQAPATTRAVFDAIGEADIAFTASLTGIDAAIRAPKNSGRIAERLAPLLGRFGLARLALNGETLLQATPPMVQMGPAQVRLPVGSFLQATAEAETVLADLAIGAIGGARKVADLFCGLGPFTLRLAASRPVLAADSDRDSIAALAAAARSTPRLKPIATHCRDLFREPLTRFELDDFEAVIFDPPRAGAESQARELAESTVPSVVAVSCDPKTLARDAAILVAGGYRLESVTAVDQFAFSPHVETVSVFRR